MDDKKQLNLGLSVGAAIIVVVALYLVFWGKSYAPSENPQNTATSTPPASEISIQKPASPKTSQKITILGPATGDKWVLKRTNLIEWSKASGFSGEIYLVDAASGNTVGWINSNTGPTQTSVDWDTQNLFLKRNSPEKKDLMVGDYLIKIKFDGPLPEITSGRFQVIYPSQVQVPSHSVSIKNLSFSPALFSAKQGDRIVFSNNDTVSHRILLSGFSPFVLGPNDSFTFDTSPLSSGNYTFYSDIYPSMKLTVIVVQ